MPEAFWIRGITEVEVKPDTDTSPRQDQRTQSGSKSPVILVLGGDAPSRRHSRHPSRPALGGTTGVSGIQWLLQVAPTVVSPQLVLFPPPSGSK